MSHCWHNWLLTLAKVPASQRVQFELPVVFVTLPAKHGVQEVEALVLLYVPTAHGVQLVLFGLSKKVPALQGSTAAAPGSTVK